MHFGTKRGSTSGATGRDVDTSIVRHPPDDEFLAFQPALAGQCALERGRGIDIVHQARHEIECVAS